MFGLGNSPEQELLRSLNRPSGAKYKLSGGTMNAIRESKGFQRAVKGALVAIGMGSVFAGCSACKSDEPATDDDASPADDDTAAADDDTAADDDIAVADDDTAGDDDAAVADDDIAGDDDATVEPPPADEPPPPPNFDGDAWPDSEDPCWLVSDIAGTDGRPKDSDGDGRPDACDLCPNNFDSDPSMDEDGDRLSAACDLDDRVHDPLNTDWDNDGVLDLVDKCRGVYNPKTLVDTDSDPSTPGVLMQVDNDGDGSSPPCDCNDANAGIHGNGTPDVHPAFDTQGDGVDSDCDGSGATATPLDATTGLWELTGDEGSRFPCPPGNVMELEELIPDTGECRSPKLTCIRTTAPDGTSGSGYAVTDNGHDSRGEEEVCDDLDNDCDGTVDGPAICECDPEDTEAAEVSCGEDVGNCRAGTKQCRPDHTYGPCQGVVGPADSDPCDGEDNDCDGKTDENHHIYTDDDGITPIPCDGVGACGAGVRECAAGDNVGRRAFQCSTDKWGSESQVTEEICDDEDNDCNGEIDDRDFQIIGGVGTSRVGLSCHRDGVCGDGLYVCVTVIERSLAIRCNAEDARDGLNPAAPEYPDHCDGLDNDCDGVADEGCNVCIDGRRQECGSDVGECRKGERVCAHGAYSATAESCVGEVRPATEVCDGLDNDCDGITDESGSHRIGDPCRGIGYCGTSPGQFECSNDPASVVPDPVVLKCNTGIGGSDYQGVPERCDTVDNDCDGVLNNGFDVGAACDEPGMCGNGFKRCTPGGAGTECSSIDRRGSLNPASDESPSFCDGLDNDCDGNTDEGCECPTFSATAPPVYRKDCGSDLGLCVHGEMECRDGRWSECEGQTLSADEVCDSEDNDCDGKIDDGLTRDATTGEPLTCRGRGECGTDVIETTEVDEGLGIKECVFGNPLADPICSVNPEGSHLRNTLEICDNKDNDCDGAVDEGIGTLGKPGEPCHVVGVCGDGFVECTSVGSLRTRCDTGPEGSRRPAEYNAFDKCDNLDNDCDGSTDEGFDKGATCTLPGVCGDGVKRCTPEGSATECSSIDRKETTDTDGDGVDSDCDGNDD